ncbi:MAG: hypothetical protein F9K23_18320 [Bacteroidetes bacterium]|nr:MAG: hypothetical protein F9K23_18320 [Bacteroidota bacterium]
MARKPKQGSGWFTYMEQQGLVGADENRLKIARKKYHAIWKREWRKQQKDSGAVYYKPRFSKDEVTQLKKAATAYGNSPTKLIQEITIGHLNNSPVLPNVAIFRKIMQLLGLIHEHLTQHENTTLSFDELDTLKARLTILENWTMSLYHNPPELLELIEQSLQRSPELITTIRQLIEKK